MAKSKEEKQAYNRDYHKTHKEQISARQKIYNTLHKRDRKDWHKEYRIETKLEVLSHYGKDGKLQCCWTECEITDPDMLTLDHVNDNGATHRKELNASGNSFYVRLRTLGFPSDHQTLCWNHQWKKEIMRRNSK